MVVSDMLVAAINVILIALATCRSLAAHRQQASNSECFACQGLAVPLQLNAPLLHTGEHSVAHTACGRQSR